MIDPCASVISVFLDPEAIAVGGGHLTNYAQDMRHEIISPTDRTLSLQKNATQSHKC